MEDNTGSRESKKKSMEDNTRSSESKEKRRKTRSSESKEKRRKSMEDNTRSSETKEKKRKRMEDNTPPENPSTLPPIYGSSNFREQVNLLCRALYARPPLRWAGSSSPHVEPGQNIVLVRPKPLGNPTAPMEADEEIIEEKAVCKVCYAILREEENILKTKCKCGNALIHETCVADGNNNCDYCEQEVQNFPVTLVRGLSSSTPAIKKKAKNVFGRFHG